MKSAWTVLKRAIRSFVDDNVMMLAAALAFYSVLSIAPMLVLVLALVGMVWSGVEAQQQLVQQVERVVGPSAAATVQTIVRGASRPDVRNLAAVVSLGALLFTSSTVFAQLQVSLNRIWDVRTRRDLGIRGTIRKRLIAIAMVFGVAILLLASLLATTALNFAMGYLTDLIHLPGGEVLWRLLSIAVPILLFAGVFTLVFYYVPDVRLRWREALVGGVATAVLFSLGKEALGLYLGRESVGSAYGAAGSLFVLLLWVYYSAVIFFLGAELTQAYSAVRGAPIVPDEHAQFLPGHEPDTPGPDPGSHDHEPDAPRREPSSAWEGRDRRSTPPPPRRRRRDRAREPNVPPAGGSG